MHRSRKKVWGTCTFHEYTARCPNRAPTVRAPNGVVLGALLENPGPPAWFLPVAGQRYFRKTQLPATGERFRTKCARRVELVRPQAVVRPGPHRAVCDGAFAVRSVVRPRVCPDDPPPPRLDRLTRLRHDARRCRWPPTERRPGQRGPLPKWGRPRPPPRPGGRWPGPWPEGPVFLDGRQRPLRWKEVVCRWRVLGHQVPVKAVVAQVAGYRQRFTLVSSATDRSGLPLWELFGARFRQEDGFRDLKQRLGGEECRAGTKNPIVRTTLTWFATMSWLRLLPFPLAAEVGDRWWLPPPWNPRTTRPSVLDVERLLRPHRGGIPRCLAEWLEDEAKAGE